MVKRTKKNTKKDEKRIKINKSYQEFKALNQRVHIWEQNRS